MVEIYLPFPFGSLGRAARYALARLRSPAVHYARNDSILKAKHGFRDTSRTRSVRNAVKEHY